MTLRIFAKASILFLFLSLIAVTVSYAEDIIAKKNESQLIKDIFGNYDPLVWPNRNNSPNWSIRVGMVINSLVDLNEKEQVLSLSASFRHFWDEPLLRWNLEEYDTSVLYIRPDMIWKPNVIIQNSVENFGQVGNDNLKVYVNHNGSVLWFPGDFYKLYCKVDVRHYPFDTQTCKIILVPFSCPQKIVNLDLVDNFASSSFASEENGEWKLVGVSSKKVFLQSGKHYRLDFSLVLQRKTLFYIVNMILPIVFLSLLNSLTFALPVNSGEKMTLCISVLLSYAVFLTLVNGALPENSDGVCFFSAYLATEIFLSAAATLATVIILSYHHQIPSSVKASKWMIWILPEPNRNKVHDEVWAIKSLGVNPDEVLAEEDKSRLVLGSDIARALDKMALRIFTITNVVVTLTFFCAMKGSF